MSGKGTSIPYESIRLYALCEAMNWSHLPVAGGLYDQHPQLIEEWMTIWHARAAYEAHKKAMDAAQQARQSKNAPRGSGGRRRR